MEILIPFKRPGILFSLLGLMHQSKISRVIIRDDGFQSPFDEYNEMLISALAKIVSIKILRCVEPKNVLVARKELFDASSHEFIVYLDSDMFLHPSALDNMHNYRFSHTDSTFIQGAKLEVNPNRTYYNEINVLGSQYNYFTLSEMLSLGDKPTYFGDTAIVGYPRKNLENIWDKIMVEDLGLGGTDVLMSAVACELNDGKPGIATPRILGHHYQKNEFKRNWEIGADRFVFEKLKSLGVRMEIYKGIYKHIGK